MSPGSKASRRRRNSDLEPTASVPEVQQQSCALGSMELKRTPRALDAQIRSRLTESLGHECFRGLARETGYNHETIRRYLTGRSRIPAAFLAVVCAVRRLDPDWILNGESPAPVAWAPTTDADPPPGGSGQAPILLGASQEPGSQEQSPG